jgi:hypothetical protein
MEKKTPKKPVVKKKAAAPKAIKTAAETLEVPTSIVKKPAAKNAAAPKKPVKARVTTKAASPLVDATAELAAAEPKVELSPVFKALAEPTLPELKRENRARLMMQTPTELYFYWTVRENPFQLLRQAFGQDTGSYTLAVKLTELNTGEEEIHPADAEGTWWFNVAPNGKYQAEVGFYAPNRPYFRIIYSNTIETPRRSPSPHRAEEAVWTVSANKFAEVLDVAGFTHDAVDVAMAGDDHVAAESAAHTALSRFANSEGRDLSGITGEDIRYVLRALAAGSLLEDLRHSIGPKLFAVLSENAGKLSSENALAALSDQYGIDESEYSEEVVGSTVYGASLVNFPRTLKRRPDAKFSPVGSHNLPIGRQ